MCVTVPTHFRRDLEEFMVGFLERAGACVLCYFLAIVGLSKREREKGENELCRDRGDGGF